MTVDTDDVIEVEATPDAVLSSTRATLAETATNLSARLEDLQQRWNDFGYEIHKDQLHTFFDNHAAFAALAAAQAQVLTALNAAPPTKTPSLLEDPDA